MNKTTTNLPNWDKIKLLAKQASKGKMPDVSRLSKEELNFLLHEYMILQQLELENREEKLQETQQELENTRESLKRHYDLTPVGYCTLNKEGIILEANQTFCQIVDKERNELLGKSLTIYLTQKSGIQFHDHLDRIKNSGEKEICNLEMKTSESEFRYFQVESLLDRTQSREILFRSTFSDITNWKMVEEENIKQLKPQYALNRLLNLLLEDISLEEALNVFLKHIAYIPWLELEPVGAVFLLDVENEKMEIKAQLNMPKKILKDCRKVKMGECLCGKAALSGKPIYSKIPEDVWQKLNKPLFQPHYLYCIPIGSSKDSIIGVYTIYLREKRKPNEIIEETLLSAARVIAGVIEHKRTEEKLKKSYDCLEERAKERTTELEEKNIALKVLLKQRASDKKELENRMVTNIQKAIVPYLERLKNCRLTREQYNLLTIIERQLEEITSPLVSSLSSKYLKMTPTETQICHLISKGSNSKEIASLMNLSPETVHKHRQNIRKKFGISHKKVNLASYLASLDMEQ